MASKEQRIPVAESASQCCCALTDVYVSYPGDYVLSVPELRIDAPCRMALLGPSGAGKSTLAGLMGGFLSPGSDVRGSVLPAATIGVVGQDSFGALNPLMRVIHQVALTAGSREAAAERLRDVGLADELHHRFPLQLSGGQRQRAAIALAINQSPNLLIADEVTSALDPIASAEVFEVLKRVTGPGTATSLLLITHNEAAAFALCDRIVRLHPENEAGGFVAREEAA